MTNSFVKNQIKADFLSTIGRNVGIVGSYEQISLLSGLQILGGCREDADSCATINNKTVCLNAYQ